MKIRTVLGRVAISLLVTTGWLGHADAREIDEIEALPVKHVQMVKTGDQYVIMSGNGRFVFGSVHDLWNDREITSTDEVREYAQRINLQQVIKNQDELYYYRYGSGKKQVAVFVDPLCKYCARIIDDAKALSNDYTFTFFPVALVNRRSAGILNGLSCQDDAKSLEQLMSHDYPAEMHRKAGCRPEKQAKTLITAKIIGVDAVPFMIAPNHTIRKGGFHEPDGLKTFLASNDD